jgi:ELWxxDGT repeat protein
LTEFRGDLYFTAETTETGFELYRLEAGSSTPTLIDINPGEGSSNPLDYTEFRGDLYFNAYTAETGSELYRLEAGSNTPTLVADINALDPGTGKPESSFPTEFFVL